MRRATSLVTPNVRCAPSSVLAAHLRSVFVSVHACVCVLFAVARHLGTAILLTSATLLCAYGRVIWYFLLLLVISIGPPLFPNFCHTFVCVCACAYVFVLQSLIEIPLSSACVFICVSIKRDPECSPLHSDTISVISDQNEFSRIFGKRTDRRIDLPLEIWRI